MSTGPVGLTYVRSLDGLRGVAVAAVLVFHGSFGHFRGGFLGVNLFFVLSGFLITGLLRSELLATGRIDWTRFYLRRAGRLLPALCILLAFTGALWPYLNPGMSFSSVLLPILLYYANWKTVSAGWLGPLAHVWSLSVEEQFYLVWPACFVLIYRRRHPIAIVGTTILVCAIARAVLHAYDSPLGSDISTLSHADELLIGALAALVRVEWSPRAGRALATVVAMLFMVGFWVVDYHDVWLHKGGSTIIALLVAGVILHLSSSGSTGVVKRVLESGPLVLTGKISYGLYLFHFPLFRLLEPLGRPHSVMSRLLVLALQLVVAFIVSWVSYHAVEAPVLRWVRGFRARAVAGAKHHDLQPVAQP